MTANWWQSPGPAALVRRAATDIRTGRCVVLMAPRDCPSGLRGEVVGQVREFFTPAGTIAVPCGARDDPAMVINDELLVLETGLRPTPARLANAELHRGQLTWVRIGDPAALDPWYRFLEDFAHTSGSLSNFDRWLIALEVSGVERPPAGGREAAVAVHEIRSYCGSFDTAFFVAQSVDEENPLARALRIAIASALALWDAELCEMLAVCELRELAAPIAILKQFGFLRGWTAETTGWYYGTDDEYDGAPLRHSSVLALSGDEAGIYHRLWRAQVGVILPFVEERRWVLGDRYAHLLHFPMKTDEGPIDDVRDLEIGPLAYHLLNTNHVDRDDRELLVLLRTVRNRLAHYQPLTTWQLKALIALPRT